MNKQRGFTLVEVLVAIAIIGILISMLLPAVQYVRAASRRTSCLNNLKQIGLAMHSYESAHTVLPEGMAFRGADLERKRLDNEGRDFGWSWSARILPQLEQNAIYDSIDFDAMIPAEPNRSIVAHNRFRSDMPFSDPTVYLSPNRRPCCTSAFCNA